MTAPLKETKKKKSSKNGSRKKKSSPTKTAKTGKTKKKSPASSVLSQEELQELLDNHLSGILILDETNKIVYANEAAATLLKKDREKLLRVRATKLKSFSEATDQLAWLGKTCRLMVENTATRRLAKVTAELKTSNEELEQLKQELLAARQRAADSDERAEETEGFLEQMEVQHSELEGQVEELQEREQEARTALEASVKQCALLSEEIAQLQANSSEDSEQARKIETLKNLLLEADEKETGFMREIAELKSALRESQDEAKIAKYDLNEALEKCEATRKKWKATQEKLGDAENRVKAASEELFKAWEAAEAAESNTKEAVSQQKKAQHRTAELEKIMEKFTPKDDDTLMGFL